MKKYMFCLFLIMHLWRVFPEKINLYASCGGSLKLADETFQQDSPVLGIKTSFGNLGGNFYCKDESYSYGAYFQFPKIIPAVIKAGRLSVSGSLSKLNNPELSSAVSPFSASVSQIKGLEAFLTGTSGISKSDSLFASIKFNAGKGKTEAGAAAFYSEEGNGALSFFSEFILPRKQKLDFQLTAGSFIYGASNSSSWFLDGPSFHGGRHFCASFQTGYSSSFYDAVLSDFVSFTPFGNPLTCIRFENRLKNRNSALALSFFLNPESGYITSSEKKTDCEIQLKLNGYVRKRVGKSYPVFLKTGFSLFAERNFQADEYSFKAAAGIQSLSHKNSVAVSADYDFSKIQIHLKNIFFFSWGEPSLGVVLGYTPGKEKVSEKLDVSLPLGNNPGLSLTAGGTFSQEKGKGENVSFRFGTVIKFSIKDVACTGKVSFHID